MMHRKLMLLLAALVLALPPAALAQSGGVGTTPLIRLKAEAVVDDTVVRLGDLFDGIELPGLAETPVARAPELGREIDIGARWLLAVARAHDLDWQPRSRFERITLRRASQTIGTEEIEAAVRVALEDRAMDHRLELVLDNPGLSLQLPGASEASLAVTGLSHDPDSGRFVAHIAAPANGQPFARISVTGRAMQLTEVPVLRRNLNPGDVIRADDIEWITLRVNRLSRSTVSDQGSLIGMSPRRPIRSQQIIRTTDLQTPIVVAKNSLVTIRLQTQRMELTVRGRALEDGAQADVVRVMNTTSNSVVNAVVIDTGTVVVTPTAAAGGN